MVFPERIWPAAALMLCLTVIVIWLFAGWAQKHGMLLDHAGGRKRHVGAIPLVGGPVLALGLIGVVVMVPGWTLTESWTLLLGIVVMATMGLADDLWNLPAWPRLLVQLALTLVVVTLGGVVLSFLGDLFGMGRIGLGPMKVVFTVLCLLFLINAVNMLDGMDGLVGGVALICCLAFSWLAYTRSVAGVGAVSVLLAAGLLAFLMFNARAPWRCRASVYLGDSGSMMLGFVLGWLAIRLAEAPPPARIAPVTIALVLLFPAADAIAAFLRRVRAGRNPLHPDRAHLHHLMLRCGFSVGTTWSLLLASHLLWVGLALWFQHQRVAEWIQFSVAVLGFTGYILLALEGRRVLRVIRRRRRMLSRC
jgi:UDP-GlcNAc:undecaprenyl-phosphate/decaprenyl-phosphate GlcNAc-1-phosphate transferase